MFCYFYKCIRNISIRNKNCIFIINTITFLSCLMRFLRLVCHIACGNLLIFIYHFLCSKLQMESKCWWFSVIFNVYKIITPSNQITNNFLKYFYFIFYMNYVWYIYSEFFDNTINKFCFLNKYFQLWLV